MSCNNCNCSNSATTTTTVTKDALCAMPVVVRPCDRADEIMNNQILENVRSYLCNLTLGDLECQTILNCINDHDLDCSLLTE